MEMEEHETSSISVIFLPSLCLFGEFSSSESLSLI
jgi:hypothetical protein